MTENRLRTAVLLVLSTAALANCGLEAGRTSSSDDKPRQVPPTHTDILHERLENPADDQGLGLA